MKRKRMFLVGRKASGTTVLVLRRPTLPPFRGPWTLRAVISTS